MQEITKDTVREAVGAAGIDFFPTATCVTCNTELGFAFSGPKPAYLSGCGCREIAPRVMSWRSLADYFYMRRAKWNELMRLVQVARESG